MCVAPRPLHHADEDECVCWACRWCRKHLGLFLSQLGSSFDLCAKRTKRIRSVKLRLHSRWCWMWDLQLRRGRSSSELRRGEPTPPRHSCFLMSRAAEKPRDRGLRTRVSDCECPLAKPSKTSAAALLATAPSRSSFRLFFCVSRVHYYSGSKPHPTLKFPHQ